MKYRNKKTEEIVEAFQYDGDLKDRNGIYYVPDWAVEAFINLEIYYVLDELHLGTCIVNVGDYLVKKDGDIFVSTQQYFESTYEPVIDECDLPFFELVAEGVTEEEIPCCVVDIMTAERLLPILSELVEQKDEEIKNLRLELAKIKKEDDIQSKIKSIRDELLKHGELYDSFVASIKSAIIERKNKYGCTILNGDLSRHILDFLIGEEK